MKQDLFEQQLSGAVNAYNRLYKKTKRLYDIFLEAGNTTAYALKSVGLDEEFHTLDKKCHEMIPHLIPNFGRLINSPQIMKNDREKLLNFMLANIDKYYWFGDSSDIIEDINNGKIIRETHTMYKAAYGMTTSKLQLTIAAYTLLRCFGVEEIQSPLLLEKQLNEMEGTISKREFEELKKETETIFTSSVISILSPVTAYRIGPKFLQKYLETCANDKYKKMKALTEILLSEPNNKESNAWLNKNYSSLIEECAVTGVNEK